MNRSLTGLLQLYQKRHVWAGLDTREVSPHGLLAAVCRPGPGYLTPGFGAAVKTLNVLKMMIVCELPEYHLGCDV